MGTSQGVETVLPLLDQTAADKPPAQEDKPNRRAIREGFQPVFLDAVNFLLSDLYAAPLAPIWSSFWSRNNIGASRPSES